MIERVIRASVENRVLVLFGPTFPTFRSSLRPITRDRRRKLLRTR